LPHARSAARRRARRLAIGFVGPLLLLGSFAFRYEFGFDALWYLVALTSVGFVPVASSSASSRGERRPLRSAAVAAAATRLSVRGRAAAARPIRESIRQTVLLSRRMRATPAEERRRVAEGD
jgi:hypothetical protein